MSEKKRLHPITIVLNTLKEIREALIPIFVTFFLGTENEDGFMGSTFFTLLPLIIILWTIFSGFAHWLRFTYRIEEGELRIEEGLFIRKKRYIPFERIQSISTSEGILQRIFGLVKMSIETAGGNGEAEATLTAISKEEAGRIKEALKRLKENNRTDVADANVGDVQQLTGGPANQHMKVEGDVLQEPLFQQAGETGEVVYMMSFKEIFFVSVTSGGALGIIAAAAAFLSQFDDWIPYDRLFSEAREYIAHGLIIAFILGIVIIFFAYVIAIVRSMLKYANFTVEKAEDHLIISYGLLEIRRITVPLKRVQGIEVRENLVRSLFGYASVYLISAGSNSREEGFEHFVVCPFIKKEKISGIVEELFPDYRIDVPTHPIPRRAKYRYMVRPVLYLALPVAIGVFLLKPWGFLLFLLFPILAFIGYLAYRFAGWNITGDQLMLRSRFFNGRTLYTLKNRIQAVNVHKNWFQRRKRLGTVDATIMSGFGGTVGRTVDLDEGDLLKIYQWYSRTKGDGELNL